MDKERDLDRVPSGRFFNKKLSQLSDAEVAWLHADWQLSDYLRNQPFSDIIQSEHALRVAQKNVQTKQKTAFKLTGKPAKKTEKKSKKPSSNTAQKLTGYVEARCHQCKKLSRISANSWSGEGIESKPKCACGGMIYLADPSSVVVFVAETHFGKRIR